MKKIVYLLVVILALIGYSCNDYESTQEKLRKEKKAIDAFIDKNDLIILKEYPKDGVFEEKEFFRTSDGLYIHVVDSGNGKRVTPLIDEVQVRFEYYFDIKANIKDDTKGVYPGSAFMLPKQFVYGSTSSYSKDTQYLACNGWAIPLGYVGEHAIVNLIIPSSLGGSNDNSSFTPVYYQNLKYTSFY